MESARAGGVLSMYFRAEDVRRLISSHSGSTLELGTRRRLLSLSKSRGLHFPAMTVARHIRQYLREKRVDRQD